MTDIKTGVSLSRIDRNTWRTVRLGDVASIKTGKRNNQDKTEHGKYPFYVRSQQVERIGSFSFDGEAILVPGEGNIGEIFHYINGKFDYHQRVYKVSNFNVEVFGKYLYYTLKAKFGTWALEQTVKATVDSIRLPTFQKFQFVLPPIDAQKSIASALSIIDIHISSLRRLIAKQEAIKKSTLKLLMTPKNGWGTARLEEVCSNFAYGVSASAISFDGVNKYIRITDIDDETQQFVPTPLASPQFFSEEDFLHPGDIVFARTGASVGKTYLYNRKDGRLIYAGFLIKASIDSNKANPGFIFLQTIMPKYKQWITTESARTGQPGINVEQLKKLPIIMPQCIKTQNNIVEAIMAEDQKLICLKKLLKKAYTVKSGMMKYFFG